MNLQKYKNYLPFIISTTLFLIIIIYSLIIYINWDKKLQNNETNVEINLPVINWDKYMNLSKQTNGNIINKDN